MPSHSCPRCGSRFDCRPEAISACDCSAVNLSPEDLADIRARYDGCLCIRCLSTIKAERKRLSMERKSTATPLEFTPPLHLRTPFKSGV